MLSQKFFISNRKRLFEKLSENSVAVFLSGDELRRSADVFYPFFANRNYYYLSGLEEPHAALAVARRGGKMEEFLFTEKITPEYERWFGARASESKIKDISGLTVSGEWSEFRDWLLGFLRDTQADLYLDNHDYGDGQLPSPADLLKDFITKNFPSATIGSIHYAMTQLRTVKDDEEIAEMRGGIRIAKEGFCRMMRAGRPGVTEYQLKAEFESAAACCGVKEMSFLPIITTGKNNFCLHYSQCADTIQAGDLILCDTGVNYNGLCCDISRVWPASGWFTDMQEKYYRCALDIREEFFARIRPGMQMRDVYRTQHRLMRAMLVAHGIAHDEDEAREYIWHGGAHHIGFDNHDEVYIEQEPENPISKNMVFAVDIGIYDLKAGIGLRIEDDCLVTETGRENLTEEIPWRLEELREILKSR